VASEGHLRSLPILVVDDEPDNLDAFRFSFKRSCNLLVAQSGTEGRAILSREQIAVVVTDQRMPRMTGLEFLARARAVSPDTVPIIVSAYVDSDVLIEAINKGEIYRYITKPWEKKEMQGVLRAALERYHLRRENLRLQEQLRQYVGYLDRERHAAFNFGQLVGDSPLLRAALGRAEQVARTGATVLLRGESGTGKELVAHAIHINSPRENKPFVRVNCAALASGVLESELFGHERGAFTGAIARHPGRFELAHGGTLFLDEIGDLPMEVQVKLLRVLQEKTVERVGGNETLPIDVRIISGTHRNLEDLVAQGRFREDLYYRLNVFPIHLPALRERSDDLPSLCEHFVRKWRHYASHPVHGLDEAALELLRGYAFPGNVRELENLIQRALILAPTDVIRVSDLEFSCSPGHSSAQGPSDAAPVLAPFFRPQPAGGGPRRTRLCVPRPKRPACQWIIGTTVRSKSTPGAKSEMLTLSPLPPSYWGTAINDWKPSRKNRPGSSGATRAGRSSITAGASA
jgi:DNA-binding NtrC family response regulator